MNQFVVDLLNRLDKELGQIGDLGIEKRLDASPGSADRWRSGRETLDDATLRSISIILGEDVNVLILRNGAESARDPRVRDAYLQILNNPL